MDDISLALNPPRFVKRRKRKLIPLTRSSAPVWPLPALNGREPVVMPTRNPSRGIELAYARVHGDDVASLCPPGTANGTATHFTPPMAAVVSVDDGVISYAGRLGSGFGMIIDHRNGTASHYANLQTVCAIRTDLYRPRDQYVRAGDVIGYVGAPNPGEFKRLYFELWQADRNRTFVPVDARPRLAKWKPVQHHDQFIPAPPEAQKEAA